jgi:pyruvate/2-oxoglutarate dehydrogenase complex dihydrolipoamide dehydrogenase (E3) component
MTERFDVFVIGGGGTGSEIAFRLGERSSLRVGLAERERLGGECNHFGCVPTKVLLRSARLVAETRRAAMLGVRVPTGDVEVDLRAIQQRARDIVAAQSGEGAAPFERVGVEVFLQEARLAGDRRVELADGTAVEAEHIVLATGTRTTVPPIPGLADGPYWTNREAIWEPERPPDSLVVVGTGAIGLEFAQLYARFGTRVTAIEAVERVAPREDPDTSAVVAVALAAEDITVRADARIERADHDDDGWHLRMAGGERFDAERVLVAAGRRPVFDGHDLDAAGVELDDAGRPVLSPTLRTTNERIWAAGDATGDLLYTHVGTYEAHVVVDDVLGRPRERDYRVVPRVTFTEPEIASVGLTEPQARDAGDDIVTATLPIAMNERALIDAAPHGLVKLVADGSSGSVLGGHVVAPEAGAMIHEIALAMTGRIPPGTVAATIHAYPTWSERVALAFATLAEAIAERAG